MHSKPKPEWPPPERMSAPTTPKRAKYKRAWRKSRATCGLRLSTINDRVRVLARVRNPHAYAHVHSTYALRERRHCGLPAGRDHFDLIRWRTDTTAAALCSLHHHPDSDSECTQTHTQASCRVRRHIDRFRCSEQLNAMLAAAAARLGGVYRC